MKFFVPFVASMAALVIAAPTSDIVEKRATVSIQQFMAELKSGVSHYTTEITKLVASVPSGATKAQKEKVAQPLISEIDDLTAFIHEANEKIAAAAKDQVSKREPAKAKQLKQPTLGDLPHDVLGQLNGQPLVLAKLLLPVLQELNPALASVLNTLALGQVDAALQPLLKVELPALVTGLANLIQGLIAALSPLLASLGGILGPLLLGLGL